MENAHVSFQQISEQQKSHSIVSRRLLFLGFCSHKMWHLTSAFFTIYLYTIQNQSFILISSCPLDTGPKLNVHKTFRRRPGRLLNVLCTFKLRPVSRRCTFVCHFCLVIRIAYICKRTSTKTGLKILCPTTRYIESILQ